jgi:Raf kinase inhibitor-like YbhB/YbcL family protein
MHDLFVWLTALSLAWTLTAFASDAVSAPSTIQVLSKAFDAGGAIPARFTCDGQNLSPDLAWSNLPAGTKSLVVICDDPDAPAGTWVHWVLYDLPASEKGLAEGVQAAAPSGACHGPNSWSRMGYGGPCPPPGKLHRYFFKVYALDAPLGLAAGATKAQVLEAMKAHVLAQGEIMGTYKRK